MFSVIIPTMWMSPAVSIMLPMLIDCPEVGEIILINNDVARTPPNTPKHAKLIIKDFGKNIYVNPAWNYGCENATFDKFCILSDDIIFDPSLFKQIDPYLTPDAGIFGLHASCWRGRAGNIRHDSIFKPVKTGRLNNPPGSWEAYGMLMFLHQTAFNHIPDQLAIFAGDTWLVAYNNKIRDKQNYYITGIDIVGTAKTTSNQAFVKERAHEDMMGALELFQKTFGRDFDFYPRDTDAIR